MNFMVRLVSEDNLIMDSTRTLPRQQWRENILLAAKEISME